MTSGRRDDATPARVQARIFDEVAETYDAVRPGYPMQLADDLFAAAPPPPCGTGRILEIGSGTGKGTRLLVGRGYKILCLEPAPRMAGLAARNFAAHPEVEVRRTTFEDWPLRRGAFHLVVSAQAFHWVDPAVRYGKAAAALVPDGLLGVFYNHPLDGEGELHDEIQRAYARHAPALAARLPGSAPRQAGPAHEIEASGLFDRPIEREYPWSRSYAASEYVDLMETQSDHRMLPEAKRAALHDAILGAIERTGRPLTVEYVARLWIARRR